MGWGGGAIGADGQVPCDSENWTMNDITTDKKLHLEDEGVCGRRRGRGVPEWK